MTASRRRGCSAISATTAAIIVLLTTNDVFAWTNPEECGRTPIAPVLESKEDRVLGGKEAVPGSWPWHAGLHESPFYERMYFCGGVLMSDRLVLTAAHGIMFYRPNATYVHLGSHSRVSREYTEQYVQAEHLCMNTDATRDIAIIKLSSSVNFTDAIQPACLPKPNSELPDNTTLYVTGWGQANELDEESRPERLQQLMTRSVSDKRCEREFRPVPDYLLCRSYDEGTPCQGDRGGPLVRKDDSGSWFLEGIVHMGGKLCYSSRFFKAKRYIKVSHFIDWIDDYLRADAEGRADSFCDMAPNFNRAAP